VPNSTPSDVEDTDDRRARRLAGQVSTSRAALVIALEGASEAGAETTLLDLRELDLPMYNPEDDEPTDGATRLIEACYGADGMLWSSPMYQGTISGAFTCWANVTRPISMTRSSA